jgi:hypothetical protein
MIATDTQSIEDSSYINVWFAAQPAMLSAAQAVAFARHYC